MQSYSSMFMERLLYNDYQWLSYIGLPYIYTCLQAITVMLFADKNDADVSGLFLFFFLFFFIIF